MAVVSKVLKTVVATSVAVMAAVAMAEVVELVEQAKQAWAVAMAALEGTECVGRRCGQPGCLLK